MGNSLESIIKKSKKLCKKTINCVRICPQPTQEERQSIQPYVFLFYQEIQPQDHIVHEKNSLLLWNSVHLFVLFLSLIPLWAYRKAWVRCIPGDAKSRHEKDKQHLFTLQNSSRIAAMVEISHMQAEQSSKVPLSHCNPQYEEVFENPCRAYFA